MTDNLSLDFPAPPELNLSHPVGLDVALARFQSLRNQPESVIRAIHYRPASEGEYAEVPEEVHASLRDALTRHGVQRLYSHQAEAFRRGRRGKERRSRNAHGQRQDALLQPAGAEPPDARTRARAPCTCSPPRRWPRTSSTKCRARIDAMGSELRAFTYDGDTPQDARKAIRERANMVLTNPDMLHAGILPHHTKWAKAFENLRYIVIDELHYYRGVYGSHLANVLRRLKRMCEFYGSKPQFICCSATIANPARTRRGAHRRAVRAGRRTTARRRARNISSSTIRRW